MKCKCGSDKHLIRPSEWNTLKKAKWICIARGCPLKPKPEPRNVEVIRTLLGYVEDSGHDGSPPSWDKKCEKCAFIRKVKKEFGIE